MSKQKYKKNRKIGRQSDHLTTDQAVFAAIERLFKPPQGAVVKPISQDILNQMQASQAPQNATQGMFSPGAPIAPVPGITPAQGPRGWQYPQGYNIGQLPRSTELTPFEQLRNFANLYDAIGLCERVWFDLCSKVEMVIKPKPGVLKDGEDEDKYQAVTQKYLDFLKKPDQKTGLKAWMRKALKDILEIDALAIYKRRTRGGGLYGLEIIDGSLIKPLLDERGLQPDPPYPAYQQYVYGVPGMLLRADELIYRRETERSDEPYGTSRIERVIMRVNQAIRKQNKDLTSFTDGSTPAGILEPPADGSVWTPDDLAEWQVAWDALLAGNDALRARIKALPPGWQYIKTALEDILPPFDMFLLNTVVASFGLTMAELAFTESVNKSSGDSQEAVIYRRAMSPIMSLFAEIFTEVIEVDFNDNRFYVDWTGYEEPEDFKAKVDAWNILVQNGTQSTSQAARELGLKPLVETGPYVLVGNQLVWVEDAADPELRLAQKGATLAGLKLAQQNPVAPGAKPAPSEEDEPEAAGEKDEATKPGQSKSKASEGEKKPQKAPATRALAPDSDDDLRPEILQQNTGIMIAFMLDRGGQQLAIPGGEEPGDLHCTLAYLGDMTEPPEDKLNPAATLDHISAVLNSYALLSQPMVGKVGGLARFQNEDADASPIVATVNLPGLQDWRNKLVGLVEQAGYFVAHDFDFTPHITLAYVPNDADMPVDSLPIIPLRFDAICLAIGDDRYYFPLGGVTRPIEDRELHAELRRWRTRAVDDIKRARGWRGFATTIISEPMQRMITGSLAHCQTVEHVRTVFEKAKDIPESALVGEESLLEYNPTYSIWEPADTDSQLEQYLAAGVQHYRWSTGASKTGVCPQCETNKDVVRQVGAQFPNGARIPRVHPGCQCALIPCDEHGKTLEDSKA